MVQSKELKTALDLLGRAETALKKQNDAGLADGIRLISTAVEISYRLSDADQDVFSAARTPVQILCNDTENRATWDPTWNAQQGPKGQSPSTQDGVDNSEDKSAPKSLSDESRKSHMYSTQSLDPESEDY